MKPSGFTWGGADSTFKFHMPILKTEKLADGRLLIEGVATSEAIDSDGEVMDYDTAKSAFASWKGNIREQHDVKKAVGRAIEVIPNDETRQIVIKAFISSGSQDTQAKILDGTLSDFSIGGKASKKEKTTVKRGDKDINVSKIYIERIAETSVVDSGANPDCSLSLVKADGDMLLASDSLGEEGEIIVKADAAEKDATEALAAMLNAGSLKPTQLIELANAIIKAGDNCELQVVKTSYSNDERTDMAKKGEALPDGSFPIKNTEDLKNAIQAYGRAADPKAAKAHIKERAKALGAEDLLPEDWSKPAAKATGAGDVQKGMYSVSNMAYTLSMVQDLMQCSEWEEANEGDDSTMPAQLRAWLAQGASILRAMVTEETGELTETDKAAKADILKMKNGGAFIKAVEKAGARNSKADQDRIQAIHDHAADLGATCAADDDDEKAAKADFTKAAGFTEAIEKAVMPFKETITKQAADLAALAADLTKFKNEAVPHDKNVRFRIIDKSQDVIQEPDNLQVEADAIGVLNKDGTVDQEATNLNLMKFIHRHGARVIGN